MRLHKEEYISNLNNYASAFNNISKMSLGFINFSHPIEIDYNKCLNNLNHNNPFFKNIDNKDGCNLLKNLYEVNQEITATNLRVILFANLLTKDFNINSSSFWTIIGKSKELDDYVRLPSIVPSFFSEFQEIQNEGKSIENKIQKLELQFEELEIPYLGDFSFTLESAIILFPIGASIGFIIFCYLYKKQSVNSQTKDFFLTLILGIYTFIICISTFFIISSLLNTEFKQYIIPDAVSIDKQLFEIILIIVIFIWIYAFFNMLLPNYKKKKVIKK